MLIGVWRNPCEWILNGLRISCGSSSFWIDSPLGEVTKYCAGAQGPGPQGPRGGHEGQWIPKVQCPQGPRAPKYQGSTRPKGPKGPRRLPKRPGFCFFGPKRQVFFFSQSIELDEPCSEVLLPSKILHRVVFCMHFGDLHFYAARTVRR